MKAAPLINSIQLILCLLVSVHNRIPIVAGQSSSSQDCSALDSQPEKTATMTSYEQDGAEAKEIAKYLRK